MFEQSVARDTLSLSTYAAARRYMEHCLALQRPTATSVIAHLQAASPLHSKAQTFGSCVCNCILVDTAIESEAPPQKQY